jgi:DNA-binding transcriptional LysR family regulator
MLGRMLPPIEDDIHADVLFQDRVVVVAGPQSRWARRRKVELSELADDPWALPPPDSTIGTLVADAFRARGMKFPPKGVAWASASLVCALLPRGPFLGTLPASLLRFSANLPRLKVLPVDLPVPSWSVGIMTLKHRTLTPVVRRFVDCAREVVRPLASKN